MHIVMLLHIEWARARIWNKEPELPNPIVSFGILAFRLIDVVVIVVVVVVVTNSIVHFIWLRGFWLISP